MKGQNNVCYVQQCEVEPTVARAAGGDTGGAGVVKGEGEEEHPHRHTALEDEDVKLAPGAELAYPVGEAGWEKEG